MKNEVSIAKDESAQYFNRFLGVYGFRIRCLKLGLPVQPADIRHILESAQWKQLLRLIRGFRDVRLWRVDHPAPQPGTSEDLSYDFFYSWRLWYCGLNSPHSSGWCSDGQELLRCSPSVLIDYSLGQTVFWLAVHHLNSAVEELNVNVHTGFICVCMHIFFGMKGVLWNGGECGEKRTKGLYYAC